MARMPVSKQILGFLGWLILTIGAAAKRSAESWQIRHLFPAIPFVRANPQVGGSKRNPALKKVDDAFWEKFQAVNSGREMEVAHCYGG